LTFHRVVVVNFAQVFCRLASLNETSWAVPADGAELDCRSIHVGVVNGATQAKVTIRANIRARKGELRISDSPVWTVVLLRTRKALW
jgi:hypothetical protein